MSETSKPTRIRYWLWRWRNRKAEKCYCGFPLAHPWSWCGMEPCKVFEWLEESE